MRQILPLDFYRRDTIEVARELIGKTLVREFQGERLAGIIVETEAYLGSEDPACHSFGFRRTTRTQAMYLNGGHSYVYFIYGMYYCFNVVTESHSYPEAVLIRAIEPTEGHSTMLKHRLGRHHLHLTNGPGKLCSALQIDSSLNALRLDHTPIWIESGREVLPCDLLASARIGLGHSHDAVHWPLRFYLRDNQWVSRSSTPG